MDFVKFPKMPRLSREMIITEKIDGTNAQVCISDDGLELQAGSRNRWITPGNDNAGFAQWCEEHKEELLKLGPGRHFGEWWGQGIQRRYGLDEKRFSLFNTFRWGEERPACCHVVPVLNKCLFDTRVIADTLDVLRENGSYAAPGFMKPEGIIIFHVAGNFGMKKTIINDGLPKSVSVRDRGEKK